MRRIDRLMRLVHALRNPHEKPPVTTHVDERLDVVERRVNEVRRRRLQLEVDNYRRRQ